MLYINYFRCICNICKIWKKNLYRFYSLNWTDYLEIFASRFASSLFLSHWSRMFFLPRFKKAAQNERRQGRRKTPSLLLLHRCRRIFLPLWIDGARWENRENGRSLATNQPTVGLRALPSPSSPPCSFPAVVSSGTAGNLKGDDRVFFFFLSFFLPFFLSFSLRPPSFAITAKCRLRRRM